MLLNKLIDFSIDNNHDPKLEKQIRKSLRSNTGDFKSLGFLEKIIVHSGLIQKSAVPQLKKPSLILYAADHGITSQTELSDSSYSKVLQYLQGNSPVNILSRQNNVSLRLIDLGVNYNFESSLSFWLHHGNLFSNKKIDHSTRDFTQFPAMTSQQCEQAFEVGINTITREKRRGCNLVALSSINNDHYNISALAVLSALLEVEVDTINKTQYGKLITKTLSKNPKTHDPFTIATLYGGFEMAALCGAIIEAARQQMMIIIDGFAALTALIVAESIKTGVRRYCITASGGSPFLLKELRLKNYLTENIKEEGMASNLIISMIKSAFLINKQP